MYFASDNSSFVPPQVMEALHRVNDGYRASYGKDPEMDEVRRLVREIFEAPDAEVFLVSTGTTANALSLATLIDPWQSIYCHRDAHIAIDECGAPEFYTGGAKLQLIDGDHGKITPEALEAAVATQVKGDVHSVQPGVLSLTNVTEAGTVYSPAELSALFETAKRQGVRAHLDGARFANAVASTGATPAELSWKAGVEVLSFGGTKNGLLGVEAVILFDPSLAWEFELRRKRGGHLFSKHRYLSAQMMAFLTDSLWLNMATKANSAAKRLARGLQGNPDVEIHHPVDANLIFATMPRILHRNAVNAGAQYYFTDINGDDDERLPCRLVCSWSTTDEDVDAFLTSLNT